MKFIYNSIPSKPSCLIYVKIDLHYYILGWQGCTVNSVTPHIVLNTFNSILDLIIL